MNNLVSLLKITVLGAFKFGKANTKKRRLWFFSTLFLIGYGLLLYFIYFASNAFIGMFKGGEIYIFVVMMLTATIFSLVTTLYQGTSTVFNGLDTSLLMSLPLKTKTIVASKVLAVYFFNIDVVLTFMVPSLIAYGINTSPDITFYLRFFILALLVPMVPIFISMIISTLISFFTRKFKSNSFVQIFIILFFVFGMLGAFLYIRTLPTDQYIEIINVANNAYPLINMFILGIQGDLVSFIVFTLIGVLSLVTLILLIAFRFKKMQSIFESSVNAHEPIKFNQRNSFRALYKKELTKYIRTPMYLLNTSIGMITVAFLSIILLFYKLPFEGIDAFFPYIIAAFVGISTTTGCSISLEGQSFGYLKMLPIKTKNIFLAKILLNLTFTIPLTIVTSTFLCLSVELTVLQGIMLFAIPITFAFFASQLGLYINLCFPSFDWTKEVTVVKQSPAAFFSMTAGVLFGVLPIAISAIFGIDRDALLLVTLTLFALSAIIMALILNNFGKKLFQHL